MKGSAHAGLPPILRWLFVSRGMYIMHAPFDDETRRRRRHSIANGCGREKYVLQGLQARAPRVLAFRAGLKGRVLRV